MPICFRFYLTFNASRFVKRLNYKQHFKVFYTDRNIFHSKDDFFHPIPLFEQKKVSFDDFFLDDLRARGKSNHKPQTLFLFLIISGLFGPALEAIGVTGDSDQVLNRIANSVVNPTPQWIQPVKSDDKGMP